MHVVETHGGEFLTGQEAGNDSAKQGLGREFTEGFYLGDLALADHGVTPHPRTPRKMARERQCSGPMHITYCNAIHTPWTSANYCALLLCSRDDGSQVLMCYALGVSETEYLQHD